MTHRLRAGIVLPFLVLLGACDGCFKSPATAGPKNTSPTKNCTTNTDCTAGNFCSAGACVPGCQTDTDCPDAGLCESNGVCTVKPQCALDSDCSAGFLCKAGVCECSTDYSCWGTTPPLNTNQICVSGVCEASASCASDMDCTGGRYCGPAQVCTAPCMQNSDCGGNSQLGALTCANGRCTAPCVADTDTNGVGGCPDGQICTANLCTPAECATFADCGDPTLYCTSATHGRCAAFTVCNPGQPEVCGPAADCAQYSSATCPPGFDCSQYVCIALPTCFVNNQCAQGETCDLGVCRNEPACQMGADCSVDQDCIGGHCLPHVCRGATDCDGGAICTAGECQAPSTGSTVYQVRLLTPPGVLEVGDSMQLLAVALDAAGNSITVGQFVWSIAPSSIASVSATGLLTALAPGSATVTVGFTKPGGIAALPDSVTFEVVAALDAGSGRVVIVDAATGAPIPGALVQVCGGRDAAGNCTQAQNLTADANGTVAFVPAQGVLDFSAADPAISDAGAPIHDIVHVLGTVATDLLIPLPGNEAAREAGFTGSINFGSVQTTGNTEIALAGSSIVDLASLQLDDIVGQQPWTVQFDPSSVTVGIPGLPTGAGIPGLGLGNLLPGDGGPIPIPTTGATVLDITSVAGIPVPIHIKDEIYALGSPGLRCLWAFAGVVDAQSVLGALTSSTQNGAIGTVLPVLGEFNHGLRAAVNEPLLPLVLDQEDLDGDGVCQDAAKCATSGELLPDYLHFPTASLTPAQPQSLQVDVIAPAAPTGTGQTLLLLGAQVPGAGLLPLGLSSISQMSGDIVAHMAPLYGGIEASEYAVVAVATGGAVGVTGTGGGQSLSALVSRSALLPTSVVLPAEFAPLVTGASYDGTSRTVTPGTNWSDVSAVTSLVRVALVGAQQRVFVYASPAAIENGLLVPPPPGAPAYDPASDPTVQGSLVAVTLPNGESLDSMAALSGPTLLNLSSTLLGFTRTPLQ